jgi:hypothetical protein
MSKRLLAVLTSCVMFVLYLSLSSNSTGYIGGGTGCSCHGAASASTTVVVSGFPTSFLPGTAYVCTVAVANLAQAEAGFNVAVSAGTISAGSAGTTIGAGGLEITHSVPKALVTGGTFWTFTWTAPTSGTSVTMNVAGNAVDLDGGTSGDQWATITPLIATLGTAGLSISTVSTAPLCNGGSGGILATLTGGAGSGFTYNINFGPYTVNNSFPVGAGTYTIGGKDALGATVSTVVTLGQPTALSFNPNTVANQTSCAGSCNGSITVSAAGGTPPYTFSKNNGSYIAFPFFNGLCAGVYTMTAKDANGCTLSTTLTVASPPPVAVSDSLVQPLCACNGEIYASAIGGAGAPYTYSVSPAGGTGSNPFLALCPTIYTLTATDQNGCTGTKSLTLANSSGLFSNVNSTVNVSCFGGNDGSATLVGVGGSGAYTYTWSNGASGATATGLTAGTYTATLTDATGCSVTATTSVNQPNLLTLSTSSTPSCGGNSMVGSAYAQAAGGVGPYGYSWSSGATTSAAANLAMGTYTVTVTDANACIQTSAVTVSGLTPAPDASFTTTATTSGFVLTANQPGNTVYQWYKCNPFTLVTGANAQTFTPTIAGEYGLIVTSGLCYDTSGCTLLNVGLKQDLQLASIMCTKVSEKSYEVTSLASSSLEYKVLNTSGAQIASGRLMPGKNNVSLPFVTTGVYILACDKLRYKLSID